METKHTKGKWTAHEAKKLDGKVFYTVKVKGVGGFVDRIICDTPFVDKFKDHEANARLIVAAPELLAACEHFIAEIEEQGDNENHYTINAFTKAEIEDAIATAKS